MMLLDVHTWCGKMKIQPHFISKCATVLQMFVVAWGVLGREDQFGLETDWLFWWCLAATVFTGTTFLIYFPAGVKRPTDRQREEELPAAAVAVAVAVVAAVAAEGL